MHTITKHKQHNTQRTQHAWKLPWILPRSNGYCLVPHLAAVAAAVGNGCSLGCVRNDKAYFFVIVEK